MLLFLSSFLFSPLSLPGIEEEEEEDQACLRDVASAFFLSMFPLHASMSTPEKRGEDAVKQREQSIGKINGRREQHGFGSLGHCHLGFARQPDGWKANVASFGMLLLADG